MVVPAKQIVGDYCRKTVVDQISLGFQLPNPVTFDIKNYVLLSLKDNPWENLAKFPRHAQCAS